MELPKTSPAAPPKPGAGTLPGPAAPVVAAPPPAPKPVVYNVSVPAESDDLPAPSPLAPNATPEQRFRAEMDYSAALHRRLKRVFDDAGAEQKAKEVRLSNITGFHTDTVRKNYARLQALSDEGQVNFNDPAFQSRQSRFLKRLRDGVTKDTVVAIPHLSVVDAASKMIGQVVQSAARDSEFLFDTFVPIGEEGEKPLAQRWEEYKRDSQSILDGEFPEPQPFRPVKGVFEFIDATGEANDWQRNRSRARLGLTIGQATGWGESQLDEHRFVLGMKPVLPPRLEGEESGSSLLSITTALQQLSSTVKGTLESSGAQGVAAAAVTVAVVQGGRAVVQRLTGNVALSRALASGAVRVLALGGVGAQFSGSVQMEAAGLLEEVADVPGFKDNPKLALGTAAVYGFLAGSVESAATLAEIAAALGVSPKLLTAAAARKTILPTLRRAIIQDVVKHPGGAVATLGRQLAEAALQGGGIEGGEEGLQGALSAIARKAAQLTTSFATLDLGKMLGEAGEQVLPGAIGGSAVTAGGAAVRITGMAALSAKIGKLQLLDHLINLTAEQAKTTPGQVSVRPPAMSADLRRAATLYGPTAYIDISRIGPAVEALATKRGLPAGDMAARLGLGPYVVSDGAVAGVNVPVRIHDVMTKWTTEGLFGTGVEKHLAADPNGPTMTTRGRFEKAALEAEEAEKARQTRLALQTEDTRALQQDFVAATDDQRQRAAYTDEVSGSLSVFALEDMAEGLAAQGYVLTKWDHQGQKVANDGTNHAQGNVLYQTAAKDLASRYEYVFKVGGSLVTAHKADMKQAKADTRATVEVVGPRMPVAAGLAGTAGEFVRGEDGAVNFKRTFDALSTRHRERVTAMRGRGQWARRGTAPTAFIPRQGRLERLSQAVGLTGQKAALRAFYRAQAEQFALAVGELKAPATDPVVLPATLLAHWSNDPQALQAMAERMYVKKDSALLTGRAFNRLQEIAPHEFTAAIDMRGLRDIDSLNSDAGDFVLAYFGAATGLLTERGAKFRVTHLHGDEYAASSDSKDALNAFLAAWKKKAAGARFVFKNKQGQWVEVNGLFFHGAVVKGDYRAADAEANRTKKLLDESADKVHARNKELLETEGPNAQLEDFPPDSKRDVRSRIRPLPVDAGVPGRGTAVGRGDGADDTLRGRAFGQNLEGLAEQLLRQQVARSAAEIQRKAGDIQAALRSALVGNDNAADSRSVDSVLRHISNLTADLLEEAEWRLATAVLRAEDKVGADNLLNWQAHLETARDAISKSALRVEEKARTALLEAIQEAKSIAEAPLIEEFKADRAKADPLWRLNRLLLHKTYIDADGQKHAMPDLALDFSAFSAFAAQGLIPQAAVDSLKAEGAFAPTGGASPASILALAGVARDLTLQDWQDAVTPPGVVTAAKREALRAVAAVATARYLDDLMALGEDTIGQDLSATQALAEIRALSSAKDGPTPASVIRKAAHKYVAALRRGDVSVGEMLKAERFAGLSAIRAALKGDNAQALLYRQEQVMYQYASQEVRSALKAYDTFRRVVKSLGKNDTLRLVGRGSPAVLAFVGGVLNKFGKGAGRFPSVATDVYEVFAEVLQEDTTANFPVNLKLLVDTLADADIAEPADLTTEQTVNLTNALMYASAFAKRQAGRKASIATFRKRAALELVAIQAEGANVRWEAGGEYAPKLTRIRQTFQGLTRSGESVFAILGRLGPAIHDFFTVPTDAAVTRHDALIRDILGSYIDLVKTHGIDGIAVQPLDIAQVRSFLPAREGDTRNTTNLTRGWAISIALNAGNRGNLYWLLTQEGWSYAQVHDFLNATLTPAEWAFVEATWKLMDEKMYPVVNQRFMERNGFSPPKVEATPMYVAALGRHVSGGYFPVRFDSNYWAVWRSQNVDEMSEIHGVAHQASAMMNKSFTMSRREFTTMEGLLEFDPMAQEIRDPVPLDLRLGIVPQHIDEVVHYVAFEQMALDLWNMAQTPEFQSIAQMYGGHKALDTVREWVKDVASGRAASWPLDLTDAGAIVQWAVHGTTAAFVGANIPLQLTDLVNPGVPAMLRSLMFGMDNKVLTYGPKALLSTYKRALTDFGSMAKEAMAASPALRAMLDDKELGALRGAQSRLTRGAQVDESLVEWARRAQWFGYDYVTRGSAIIAWHSKMLDAAARGVDPETAKRDAEEFLHAFVVSHRPEYKSALLRKSAILSEFARFRSFFFKVNGEYLRRATHPLGVRMIRAFGDGFVGEAAVDLAVLVGAQTGALVLTGLVAEVIAGSGPEEKEDVWAWSARKIITGKLAAVPILGHLADPIAQQSFSQGASMRTSPFLSMAQLVGTTFKAMDDRRATDKRVWDAIRVALGVGGLPANQVARTGSYLTDLLIGHAVFVDWAEAVESTLYGQDRRGMTPFDLGKGRP